MAVEARRQNLLAPQFILNNRQLVNGHLNIYGTSTGHIGLLPPLSGTTTETIFPAYTSAIAHSFPAKPPPPQSDSGTLPISRKRTRDSIDQFDYTTQQNHNHLNCSGHSFSFLGEDISLQIQSQQFEIDNFIAQHLEKITYIEKQLNPNARKIIAAVEERIVKKLRAKEEEVDKLGKINCALEEKVKSLYTENQIWRELAQTNEATVTALRSNLEQVLSQIHHRAGATNTADDAQSCCGSNTEETLADNYGRGRDSNVSNGGRWCRSCGKEEACVLVLPCRHLCLCTACGATLHVCPVCKSTKNASLHIDMSFS